MSTKTRLAVDVLPGSVAKQLAIVEPFLRWPA
jgi:hypothetical protein